MKSNILLIVLLFGAHYIQAEGSIQQKLSKNNIITEDCNNVTIPVAQLTAYRNLYAVVGIIGLTLKLGSQAFLQDQESINTLNSYGATLLAGGFCTAAALHLIIEEHTEKKLDIAIPVK